MKVILAEKPSVARDIAAVVGANEKKAGYLIGNDYAVTYAFGHLVQFAEPEEMNPAWGKPWRLEQLPMIPTDWKYTVNSQAAEQFNIIKRLFLSEKTQSIICATDAGREGEHIFRLIYMYSGCTKPVERLWISSLTAEAIKDGLSKLRPASEFDNLAHCSGCPSTSRLGSRLEFYPCLHDDESPTMHDWTGANSDIVLDRRAAKADRKFPVGKIL